MQKIHKNEGLKLLAKLIAEDHLRWEKAGLAARAADRGDGDLDPSLKAFFSTYFSQLTREQLLELQRQLNQFHLNKKPLKAETLKT